MTPTLAALVYLALLAALALGALRKPPVAVAGVFCLFGLKQWAQAMHPWLAQHPLISNFAVATIVVLALAARLLSGRGLLRGFTSLHATVLALYAYAALSLAWTPDLPRALEVWQHDLPYILTAVVASPLLIQSRDDFAVTLSWTMGIGAVLLALLLAFGNWGSRGLVVGQGLLQDETNPLALAGLAGSVACAAMFTQSQRLRGMTWPLRLVILAVAMLVIIRSGSRGQLVAVLLAIVLALPIGNRISRLGGIAATLTGLLVLAVTLAYGLGAYVQWFDARWTESTAYADAEGRLGMVLALLEAWVEGGVTVLTGLGNSAAFSPSIAGFYPHNVPLEVLGEEGLFGFALYLMALALAVRAIITARRAAADDAVARGIVGAAAASFAFFFFVSLKEGNMIGSVYFFLYAIALGSIARTHASTSYSAGLSPGRTQREPMAFPNVMR